VAKPIYKMYMVRLIEPWYQLSEEEQANMLEKVDAARTAVGGKQVLLCDSAWASEQWQGFGIEVYPSVEALQQHSKLLLEIGWYRYIESDTVLGTNSADHGSVWSGAPGAGN
jgi:hypothetical protein